MANRAPTQPSDEFEELCDQRDELAVKLSLLEHSDERNAAMVQDVRVKIFDLDKRIKTAWKGPLS